MDSPHEDQYQQQKVSLVANFIEEKGPGFHRAFAVPSSLNRSNMKYEPPEVTELRETLECQHQKASRYVDFTSDLATCSWDQVHIELKKAQAAVVESDRRGRNPIRKAYRAIGNTSSILAPGLAALPDELGILHGGLALIFSLARHSELNRVKILNAFENVPNIIEMARNKAQRFPLDGNNTNSVSLHNHVRELQQTLLKMLPVLIDKLVPGSWRNAWKSPFGGWKIDHVLDSVKVCAEAVRGAAEGLIEDIIVDSYSAQMTIKSQLNEIIRQNRMMYMSMSLDAATQGKTHLFNFLSDQLNLNTNGVYPPGHDQGDLVSERGTALPGYTPEDLLKIIDVNHLRITNDESHVIRRYSQLPQADIDRAAQGITTALKDLLITTDPSTNSPHGPTVVAIDGHFDRTQIGQISAITCVCAMLGQAFRQQAEQAIYSSSPAISPTSPSPNEKPIRPQPIIILEYFCSLHTSPDDDLSGPQGLIRCLCTQLILSLLAYEWITPASALDLRHLQVEGEEELLSTRNIMAMCHLFAALMPLVPEGVPVYIIVDSFSAYEREEKDIEFGWREQYEMVVDAFRDAMDAGNAETGGNCVRLLVTSPTKCRWLSEEFVLPGQRVSLRGWKEGSGVGGKNWRGRPGGLVGLARAATMPSPAGDVGGGGGFGGGYPGYPGGGGGGGYQGGLYGGGYEQPQQQQQYYAQQQYTGQPAQPGGYDRRSST